MAIRNGLAIGVTLAGVAAAVVILSADVRLPSLQDLRDPRPEHPNGQSGAVGSLASLVPKSIHISSGLYSGYDIDLLPEAVLDADGQSRIPVPIPRPVAAWTEYPVPLCIPHSRPQRNSPRTAELASAVADAVDELNSIVGMQLIRPLSACPFLSTDDRRTFTGIVVGIADHTSGNPAASFAHTYVSKECSLSLGDREGCVLARIQHAEIRIRVRDEQSLDTYREGGVIQHELLHALGLDHTCASPTLLFEDYGEELLARCRAIASSGMYPPPRQTSRPSPYDVAHLFLLQDLMHDQAAVSATRR